MEKGALRLLLLSVGGIRGPLAPAIQDYEDRARRYWRMETLLVEAGRGRGTNPGAVMAAEEGRLLARLPPAGEVLALARDGKAMGSRELAAYLQDCALRSVPDVTFVIGGAFGLGRKIQERATRRVSLSALTLPHEVARLVLAEQLYRAGTILRSEPYHKGP